jgi:hypothetical protein
MPNKLKEAKQVVRKTKNLQQETVKLNWKTHKDLKHLQADLEQMTWDYTKMDEFNM